MKKFLCLLAIFSSSAFAQAAVPWNVAEITIVPPTEYADGSGLVDTTVAPLTFQIETLDPGKTDWRILTTVTALFYRHVGLTVGKHSYRVKVLANGAVSAPSNEASKDAVPPPTKPASVSIR